MVSNRSIGDASRSGHCDIRHKGDEDEKHLLNNIYLEKNMNSETKLYFSDPSQAHTEAEVLSGFGFVVSINYYSSNLTELSLTRLDSHVPLSVVKRRCEAASHANAYGSTASHATPSQKV